MCDKTTFALHCLNWPLIIVIILIIAAIAIWLWWDDGGYPWPPPPPMEIHGQYVRNFAKAKVKNKPKNKMKLKIGDRVVNTYDKTGSCGTSCCMRELLGTRNGWMGQVKYIWAGIKEGWVTIQYDSGEEGEGMEMHYKLINKSFMSNLIEKARLLAKGEPEKSLTAKGITDINDVLTADGEQLFKDFLYRANKTAFVADPTIAALLAEKDEK